ncbi:uncharacterized protein LOC127795476 [Diospyros lotus]|uniref:uncharacterized protein LOC127795476 n=1 Tax=Diospyros lotus TaxID=55363 RepID=UPI0022510C17|nr:uncharacterized protein LOC127795476 [Diospyros lotus]
MAASCRRTSGPVLRSLSPTGKFYAPSLHSSPPARSTNFHRRSASPESLNLHGSAPAVPSVPFCLDSPISQGRSISLNQMAKKPTGNPEIRKRSCMCSPTTHPGSFRCSLHKNFGNQSVTYPSSRLNTRRSAMANSQVRIGSVEGDLVKRALAVLIRPSSRQQRRRLPFHPTPSRLSLMWKPEAL